MKNERNILKNEWDRLEDKIMSYKEIVIPKNATGGSGIAAKPEFVALLDSVEELDQRLHSFWDRLSSKVDVLVGSEPQQPAECSEKQSPNGVLQSIHWRVNDMIRLSNSLHREADRLDEFGIGT